MKMEAIDVEIKICCRVEFFTQACPFLRKLVNIYYHFWSLFEERGENACFGNPVVLILLYTYELCKNAKNRTVISFLSQTLCETVVYNELPKQV